MKMPDVVTSIRDEANNYTYNVLAYRTLSRQEMLQAISHFKSQPKMRRKKRPLRNGSVTIVTIHGATPRI